MSNIFQESDVLTITWSIENFSVCPLEKKQCLTSARFTGHMFGKAEFALELYPRGYNDEIHIACHLIRLDHNSEDITLGFKICVTDLYKADPTFLKNGERFVFNKETCFWGCNELINREEVFKDKERYLPRDVFTVRCHIWFFNLGDLHFDGSFLKKLSHIHDELKISGENAELIPVSNTNLVKSTKRNVAQPSEIFVRTRIPMEQRCFKWSIKDISTFPLGYKHYMDICSSSKGAPSLTLELHLTESEAIDGVVHIKICRTKQNKEQMFISVCQISVYRDGKNSDVCVKDNHFFNSDVESNVWYLPPLIMRKLLINNRNAYLLNDVLTLQWKMLLFRNVDYTWIEDIRYLNCEYPDMFFVCPDSTDFTNDLNQMYKEQKFCDVTLQAEDRSIAAHKIFLCSKSDVFKAMFKSHTIESGTSVVHIEDVEGDILDKMLTFVYSETLAPLHVESAIKLYSAADKYQILKLKKKCSDFLEQNLSPSNICLILPLADMHLDDDLMQTVIDFICLNKRKILLSEEWKQLSNLNPKLTTEVLTRVCLMFPEI